MDIIHIVANNSPINMGVWDSSLRGEDELIKAGVYSHFWTCSTEKGNKNSRFKEIDLKESGPQEIILQLSNHFPRETTIMVTHGAWLAPTRLGYYAALAGFTWIYVPHGMLEPWSLGQNRLFKSIYYRLFEKKYLQKVSAIRAVSQPEKSRLLKSLGKKTFYSPNSVAKGKKSLKKSDQLLFVFIARLHFKKGILPLMEAWKKIMSGNPKMQLKIVGPDEGELVKIKTLMGENSVYLGSVYGTDKQLLLQEANYYILPSYSEGLPSSVLEAMSFGAIPLISQGCNFEEVFENDLGYKAEPHQKQLENLFNSLKTIPYDQEKSNRNVDWIHDHYREDLVAQNLIDVYKNLLNDVYQG